jgi:hypothetical protein
MRTSSTHVGVYFSKTSLDEIEIYLLVSDFVL